MNAKNGASAHGTLAQASVEELAEFDARWATHRAEYGDRTYNELHELHVARGFWDVSDPNFDGIDARGFDYAYEHAWTGETVDHDGRDWRGVDESGFDLDGWSADGYDREGYNIHGYGRDGLHRNTGHQVEYEVRYKNGVPHRIRVRADRHLWKGYFNVATGTPYDEDGYTRSGFDALGYDREGYDERGFDKDGLTRDGSSRDADGLDADGFATDGFRDPAAGWMNRGLDRQGFSRSGHDENARSRQGHFQGSKRESLWWASERHDPWYMPEGSTQPFYSGFPYTRKSLRPWDIYADCSFGVWGGGGSVIHGRNSLTLHWRARELFVLGQFIADVRKTGAVDPIEVREWVADLEALKGEAITQMPASRGFDRRNRQMMALALRAGLGYAQPGRRELIDLGYEEVVRHYVPTLKWRKRSTLGSAA